MPSISQDQANSAGETNGPIPQSDGCHGDEWMERHSGSSDFVRSLRKKFQDGDDDDRSLPRRKLTRPSSTILPASRDYTKNNNHHHALGPPSERPNKKMTSTLRSEAKKKDLQEVSLNKTPAGKKSSLNQDDASKTASMSPDVLNPTSISKLSSIFETGGTLKNHATKNDRIEPKISNDGDANGGGVDYLSVLKPSKTSEWNRSMLVDRPRPVSADQSGDRNGLVDTNSFIKEVRSTHKTNGDTNGSSLIHDLQASSTSSLSNSSTSSSPSRNPPENNFVAKRSDDTRLKGILKKDHQQHQHQQHQQQQEQQQQQHQQQQHQQEQQQQLVNKTGAKKEIVFRRPSDDFSDEVPFFRLVLKRSEHSDAILYEDVIRSQDSKIPHSQSPRERVEEEAKQCKVDVPVGSKVDNRRLPQQRSSADVECVDYLSVLKKNKKDKSDDDDPHSVSNEAREVPSYRLKKTNHSSLLLHFDNFNKQNNKQNNKHDFNKQNNNKHDNNKHIDNNHDEWDDSPNPNSPSTFKSEIFLGRISSSSSSSSPLLIRRDETEINSNSQESLPSSSSDRDFEPKVVLRKLSSDGHLGDPKRRAIIRLSDLGSSHGSAHSSFQKAFASYDCYMPSVSCDDDGDDDDDDDDDRTMSRDAQNGDVDKVQSKLEMTLKELHQSEINYIDKLELIEHFKSELLRMKAITEQESNQMFLNMSDILRFHKEKMLPQLERCATSGECCVGEAFDELAPKLIIYSDCLASFSDAMRTISQKEKKNAFFQRCLREIQEDPRCGHLTLQNHMLNLVQRIPKYLLLMKQYLKYLPQDSADFARTKIGLQSLTNVAHCNNRSIKKTEKRSLIARGGANLELLCISCGRDVTNKHVRCTNCQKFYCKSCFTNRQSYSMKPRYCFECLRENRKSILKIKTENLRVKDGMLMVKKSREAVWAEQWFVIDASGRFYSVSSAKDDFDRVDMISLENAKLRLSHKPNNMFILHLKNNKTKYFKAPSKEEFDGWIEGFKSVLSEKQFIMFDSFIEGTKDTFLESET